MVLSHLSNGSEEDIKTIVESSMLKALMMQLRSEADRGRYSPLLLGVISNVAEKSQEGRRFMIRKDVISQLANLIDVGPNDDTIRSAAAYGLRSFCVDAKYVKELDDRDLEEIRRESEQSIASGFCVCHMGYKTRVDELKSSFWRVLYDGEGVCGCIPCTALGMLHPYPASYWYDHGSPERKVKVFSRLLSSKCDHTVESACVLLHYTIDRDSSYAEKFCTDEIIPQLTCLTTHKSSSAIRYKASLALCSILKHLELLASHKREYLVEQGVASSFCGLLSDKEIINTVETAVVGLINVRTKNEKSSQMMFICFNNCRILIFLPEILRLLMDSAIGQKAKVWS